MMRHRQPQQPMSAEAALSRASALCSRGEQAESDIATRLRDWGLGEREAADVLRRLRDEGFLDERRYAVAFARDRFKFNGWGRLKIARHLQLKHISRTVIEQALAEIDEVDYRQSLNRLLRAKARSVNARPWPQAMAALLRLGASRGFESDLCHQTARDLLGSPNDETQDDELVDPLD